MVLLLALMLNPQESKAISLRNMFKNFCERELVGEDPYQYEHYTTYQLWMTFERYLLDGYESRGIMWEAKRRLPFAKDERERELLLRILR